MALSFNHKPAVGVITERITICAQPEVTCVAITSPNALAAWLCDSAWVEKRPAGRLYLQWHSGRHALGYWTEYQPPDSLAWSWQDAGEASPTTIRFTIKQLHDAVEVRVDCEVPSAKAESLARTEWNHALQRLKMYVEDGLNGRYLRRPLLGIDYSLLTPALAQDRSLSIAEGILIDTVAPGGAAAAAGLRQGDVLLGIEEFPLTDWPSLVACLDRFQAGDNVKLRVWRNHQERWLPFSFGGRQPADLPMEGARIATLAHTTIRQLKRALRQLLADVSDREASWIPPNGEWSIKQQLVDLSLTLRGMHEEAARFAADEPLLGPGDEAFDIRQAFLGRLPVQSLRTRVLADLSEYDLELGHILEGPQPAPVRRWLVEGLHATAKDINQHIERMQRVLAAAREPAD